MSEPLQVKPSNVTAEWRLKDVSGQDCSMLIKRDRNGLVMYQGSNGKIDVSDAMLDDFLDVVLAARDFNVNVDE